MDLLVSFFGEAFFLSPEEDFFSYLDSFFAAKVTAFEISSKFSTTILLRYNLHPLRFYYVHFCNLLSIIDLNIEKNMQKIFLFQ